MDYSDTSSSNDDKAFQIKARIRQSMLSRIEQGMHPYGGQWLPADELEKSIKKEKKTGRTRGFELLFLNFIFALISLLLIVIVLFLAY
jgi:hypothetical protein